VYKNKYINVVSYCFLALTNFLFLSSVPIFSGFLENSALWYCIKILHHFPFLHISTTVVSLFIPHPNFQSTLFSFSPLREFTKATSSKYLLLRWDAGDKSDLVSIGTHKLYLSVSGPNRKSGEPIVLLMQGLGSTIDLWVAVKRHVTPFARWLN
jgi:hypothetical protein